MENGLERSDPAMSLFSCMTAPIGEALTENYQKKEKKCSCPVAFIF